MKILAVGGGSGGHVTPVVAVLRELKLRQPGVQMRFWCDVKFAPQAIALLADFDTTVPVHRIASGKFRRYYHLTFMQQLLWPRLVLLNIRDSFLVAAGLIQSIIKLLVWRPDVVFTKGGYVCLPVGIAAHLLRIPLVIHDSDAHPGLTNRMLARWADSIATGAPLEYYRYPKAISRYVGIPISDEFHAFSSDERLAAKSAWNVDLSKPLIVVTGGGLGAQRINDTVIHALPELLKLGSVILVSGAAQYDALTAVTPNNNSHFQLHPFVSSGMAQLLGAADVVVTRAGATTILELAALARPTVLIPNGKLTGGHQLKNAKVYADADAVKIVDETEMTSRPSVLIACISDILVHPADSEAMAQRLATFARPDAARNVADMIIDAAS